jgi:hypothetical protein
MSDDPTPRRDNVLTGPWLGPPLNPAQREERERLRVILGDEEADHIEHIVFSRNLLDPLPDYTTAVLEALRERAAYWTAKRGW